MIGTSPALRTGRTIAEVLLHKRESEVMIGLSGIGFCEAIFETRGKDFGSIQRPRKTLKLQAPWNVGSRQAMYTGMK